MTDEQTLLREYTREILDLERGGHRIRLELSPNQAVALIGQVQLALQHPGNRGSSAAQVRLLVKMIERQFQGSSAVLETIRLGWEQSL